MVVSGWYVYGCGWVVTTRKRNDHDTSTRRRRRPAARGRLQRGESCTTALVLACQ